LQQAANDLLEQTQNLTRKLNEKPVDGSQVNAQHRGIERGIDGVKGAADQATGANRDVNRALHDLQGTLGKIQQLQEQAAAGKKGEGEKGEKGKGESGNREPGDTTGKQEPGDTGKGGPGKTGKEEPGTQEPGSEKPGESDQAKGEPGAPSQAPDGQNVPSGDTQPASESETSGTTQPPTGAMPQTPDVFHLPDGKTLEQLLQREETSSRIEPIDMPPYDPDEARRNMEDQLQEITGLNASQRAELESWYQKKIHLSDGTVITVREMADAMVEALRVLTLPAVKRRFIRNKMNGPILYDLVKLLFGSGAFGKWKRKFPLPVKMSFLIDTSGSMGMTKIQGIKPIDMARITTLVLLTALIEHNEERESLGYDPIEFAIALFNGSPANPLVSFERTREQDYRKERLLYETWNGIKADGGTHYAENFKDFTDHLTDAEDVGSDESLRVMIVLSDEDVDETQKGKVLGVYKRAEEDKIHHFIVPMGNDEQVEKSVAMHQDHPERIIVPRPFNQMPALIMTAFLKTIPPPAEGVHWTSTLTDQAMLTDELVVSEPRPIPEYKRGHFFYQTIDGKECLVFKRGNEFRY
ncbi:MAG TPA: hypothetical protein VLJ10_00975, partial [Candidatus Bathyarchaeia archaeon]|nr:hypothetical protein [Candidatus Bathyarchaeia archaeon]